MEELLKRIKINKYITAIKAANAVRIATYIIVGALSLKNVWKVFKMVMES